MPLARFSVFILSLLCFAQLRGQSVSRELAFAKYLQSKKNFDESIHVLQNLKKKVAITQIQKDSIHFLLGNVYYDLKSLKNSINNFDSVSELSHRMKAEAVFFSSFNSAYTKSFAESERKLTHYNTTDSIETQLKTLELAGVSLLQRNLKNFDSLSRHFSSTNYSTDLQEKRMVEHYTHIKEQPKKSPFVAAMLSVVLPGAGRFYAGNKGQGMYTLLISTVLGLQAWEGYHKDGPSSFRFIAYTTIFTSIYIGSIWGSTFAVKLRRDQYNETINDQILFDMHIPLRTVFH